MKTTRTHFKSWCDLIAAATAPVRCHYDNAASVFNTEAFSGTRDFAQAEQLARFGWADGLDRMDDVFRNVAAQVSGGDEILARFCESGEEVDVGMYLEGDPECMIEYVQSPSNKRVVRMVVSASFSGAVSRESIFNRGAAVMAVVDGLEDRGIRVELVLDFSVTSRGANHYRTAIIKAAEEPMDRDRIVFAICHPSMLRRLIFRLHETESEAKWRELGGGSYGYVLNPEKTDDSTFIMPGMNWDDDDWSTPCSAAAAAVRIIDEITK